MSFLTESEVRQFWKDCKIFEKSLQQNEINPKYTFFDGPPFASGNPHHGHALAGVIKDVVTRYWSMMGYYVPRRFGWDTHGVPIESKINIKLGIKSKEDVEKFGIKEYNEECRQIVMSCQEKWKAVCDKLGRWIDMDNAYKTMDPSFMNSVWYVFNELYKKDLIYHGVKIMSFSPGLSSPLSNNEANQNYKSVNDPSLTLQIPANISAINLDGSWHESTNINILVWTTTPWTLPINLLLCVHPNLVYVFIERNSDNKYFLVAKQLVNKHFKKDTYKVIKEIKGEYLVGISYTPLFDFYKDITPAKHGKSPFKIVADEMVSADTGTGIVHIAPGFGQEDYNVAYEYGIISEEVLPPCPLDDNCHYTEPVNNMDILKDRFVKDCDKDIVAYLKENGMVFKFGNIVHDYPYCYRTDTPLIYRTYPAWFIKVKPYKEKIHANLKKTNWVPKYVRDNKYSQSLDNVVDWCISRNRFWGTPMPIWQNDDGEMVVVGSSMELEKLANLETGSLTDLHPENIWNIEIPSSKPDGKPLQNVRLVLDCWFESGSMPFGQWGYPYSGAKLEDIFPADFIAEGTDQTRGWFHALMVLSTLLLDKIPFRNLIINGIVQSRVPEELKGSGKGGWMKMSKKYGNYDDIETVMDKYGSDTLRLYLLQSPGVKAGDVPFDTKMLPTIRKNCHIMFQNMVQFWKQSLDMYQMFYNEPVVLKPLSEYSEESLSILDMWILQEVNQFLTDMSTDLENYNLFPLSTYIDRIVCLMSRWYLKLSKKSLKGEHGQESMLTSFNILTHSLYHVLMMIAPLMPHMTETFYQFMKNEVKETNMIDTVDMFTQESIHLNKLVKNIKFPVKKASFLMKGMRLFINVLEQMRSMRTKYKKPLKFPIKKVTIAYNDSYTLDQLKKLEYYLKPEINCDVIEYCSEPQDYVNITYRVNMRKIGQKYRKDAKDIINHFNTYHITPYYFEQKPVTKFRLFNGTDVEVDITYFDEKVELKSTLDMTNKAISNCGNIVVVADLSSSNEIEDRYIMNCLIREIQEMRKNFNLNPTDKIDISYVDDASNYVVDLLKSKYDYIKLNLHQDMLKFSEDLEKPIASKECQFADKHRLTINFHQTTK